MDLWEVEARLASLSAHRDRLERKTEKLEEQRRRLTLEIEDVRDILSLKRQITALTEYWEVGDTFTHRNWRDKMLPEGAVLETWRGDPLIYRNKRVEYASPPWDDLGEVKLDDLIDGTITLTEVKP